MEPRIQIIKPGQSTPDIAGIERLARFLDSRFVIPGTNIRFGLDPILSLFPVIGDLITFLISGMLIQSMYTHGASRKVVIKMVLNATLDTVIGAIPVVGTIFDIFYRANDRNVKLLREYYYEGKHQGSGKGLLLIIILAAIIIVGATCYGVYKLFEAIL